jgi:ribosome maturation factor RimP
MAVTDRVRDLVEPLAVEMGLSMYDIELNGGNLRITVDGPDGVLLDQLAELTKAFSHVLDEEDPMPGNYTLEVSSPGLERRLRLPEHFAGAVDEEISVKLGPHIVGERRVSGLLSAAAEDAITITDKDGTERVIDLDDITKAVTIFDWGPTAKPGSKQTESKNTKSDAGATPASSNDPERRAAVQ